MVPPTQKNYVESNGGSLENVAKVVVLFLFGVQLVLRSGVLTALYLDEVDVLPRFAEVFGSVLSGFGGSAGGWRFSWGAPASLPQLPPATPKNPPRCHNESWYQLKHGLHMSHKGEVNVSSLSTREGIDVSSNAQEEMAQTSLRKERACYKRTI